MNPTQRTLHTRSTSKVMENELQQLDTASTGIEGNAPDGKFEDVENNNTR
jgi:hypothetical protein